MLFTFEFWLKTMIKIHNLSKTFKSPVSTRSILNDLFHRQYKEKTAVDSISFEIGENELVGFIGPNGAGKTTTMKMLAGILYPTEGSISVLNFTPFEKKPEYLQKIGFIMGQRNQLIWELPPMDTFALNKIIYKMGETEYKKSLRELVTLLDAEDFVNQPVKTLSLGQRMRAELIAALLHRPKILFLDEPTIGLDIFAQSTITEFIKDYQHKYKATIMLTSHYMQDVQRLAKRVIMIDKGKIVYNGNLTSLTKEFADKKVITITVSKKIENLRTLLKGYATQYTHPQLKVEVPQKKIAEVMSILEGLDYIDITIENEPLEETVKRVFESRE